MAGKQAKILSDKQISDLLFFAEMTRYPLRNRVIVLLSCKAGLRAGEIAKLTWDMVLDANVPALYVLYPGLKTHPGHDIAMRIAVGLLRVQARSAQSEDVQTALNDAASRVGMIAQVHDHLWRSTKIGFVELANFMGELCKKMNGTAHGHTVLWHTDPMTLAADQAIPLGLLINELVTNAVKHAYPDGPGVIHVFAHRDGLRLQVEISDQGTGLPAGFDIDQPRTSLGFKVVNRLARQLKGHLTVASNEPSGACFRLDMPLLGSRQTVPLR